jgi:hypothetical protein
MRLEKNEQRARANVVSPMHRSDAGCDCDLRALEFFVTKPNMDDLRVIPMWHLART